jgi:serine/threonine protein kinase
MSKPSWIGVTLNGRYTIEELLGQGGMSAVYKATDPNLRRVVAVKLIHTHLADNQEFLTRFEEEAAAVARLRHPNIVQVYDFDHDDGTYYMVLEFVPGESLNARLRRLNQANRQLPLDEALGYLAQVSDAVEYAHRRGMVHRDIKPANIILDVQGQAILMDFGIVKIVGGDKHTATGAVLGTALYMSPEQIKGESAEARSDIYSLGVSLFEMLSGKPPFQADSVMTVMMMHLSDPVPDLRDLRPGVPAVVVEIIQKAMAKDPADRYQSAAELAAALRTAQAQLRETAVKPEAMESATVVDDRTTIEAPGSTPPPLPEVFRQPDNATLMDSSPGVGSIPASPPAGWQEASPKKASESTSTGDTGPMPVLRPQTGSQRVISTGSRGVSESGSHAARQTTTPPERLRPAQTGQTAANVGLPKALPWALLAAGGAGFLLLAVLVVGVVLLGLRAGGGDGSNQALLAVQASQTAGALALIVEAATPTASATSGPTATSTLTPTATLQPTVTHTQPPTETPTVTVPPGILYVRINRISVNDQNRYVVEYETFEYTEVLPGLHVHFFFDTVPPEQAGLPGRGPWILYGGPRPFTGYSVSDRPAAAEQMCALVANADHSVQANSGNCFKLP